MVPWLFHLVAVGMSSLWTWWFLPADHLGFCPVLLHRLSGFSRAPCGLTSWPCPPLSYLLSLLATCHLYPHPPSLDRRRASQLIAWAQFLLYQAHTVRALSCKWNIYLEAHFTLLGSLHTRVRRSFPNGGMCSTGAPNMLFGTM